MISNQIEYKVGQLLIIDKFTTTDKAEALLCSLLMNKSFSGTELINFMTVSQDLKQCIRYLIEKKLGCETNPFYEKQISQMKLKTKKLGLQKILDVEYINSNASEKRIKKVFEKINGVSGVVFSNSEDFILSDSKVYSVK